MVKQYQVVFTLEARQTLRKVTDYIRRTDSDVRAKYVRKGLLKSTRHLINLPNSHPVLLTSSRTNITYRFLPKWQFKIIFTVEEDINRVIINRIFHDKQSPDQLEDLLL